MEEARDPTQRFARAPMFKNAGGLEEAWWMHWRSNCSLRCCALPRPFCSPSLQPFPVRPRLKPWFRTSFSSCSSLQRPLVPAERGWGTVGLGLHPASAGAVLYHPRRFGSHEHQGRERFVRCQPSQHRSDARRGVNTPNGLRGRSPISTRAEGANSIRGQSDQSSWAMWGRLFPITFEP